MYLAGVFVAFEKHDQREKEKEKTLFFCIYVGLKKPKKYSLMRWRATVCVTPILVLLFVAAKRMCIGHGWDRVTFLCRSLCGPVFQICEKMVLVTHRCFSHCSAVLVQCQGVLGCWGRTRSREGDTAGTADPADESDIPYHMMSQSAMKGGDIQSYGVRLQVTVMCDGAWLSWRQRNICLLMGNSE